MGAVTGDHAFLNTVTKAQINPPNIPISIRGITSAISRDCMNRCHVQAAEAMAQMSRTPVLFTVPLRVMRSAASIRLPDGLAARSRKVWSPSAGLDVFISAMILSIREIRCDRWPGNVVCSNLIAASILNHASCYS